MIMVPFNVNDTVKVRLTDVGKNILKDRFPVSSGTFKPSDESGWTTWHLWELMEILGEHISSIPFETAIVLLPKSGLEPATEIDTNALVKELEGKLEREQCISAALRDDVKAFLRKEELLKANQKKLADAAEMLWSVMANVAEGDWTKQSQVWQDAAAVWRDNYFKILNEIK